MTIQFRSLAQGVRQLKIGNEATPLLIIDDLLLCPEWLKAEAIQGQPFSPDPANFYPGIRKPTPALYQRQLQLALLPLLKSVFAGPDASKVEILMSAYALSTTPAKALRPIQMLPHIDSVADTQLAMVHYLCDAHHGGTSFYRHRQTGYERITQTRLARYSQLLKSEAMAAQLHLQPAYMQGDNDLFARFLQIEAKPNRAIIYPGNLLHSGNIQAEAGLSAMPQSGRLTISSFFQLS